MAWSGNQVPVYGTFRQVICSAKRSFRPGAGGQELLAGGTCQHRKDAREQWGELRRHMHRQGKENVTRMWGTEEMLWCRCPKSKRNAGAGKILLHHFSASALAWAVPGTALALWAPQAPGPGAGPQKIEFLGDLATKFRNLGRCLGHFRRDCCDLCWLHRGFGGSLSCLARCDGRLGRRLGHLCRRPSGHGWRFSHCCRRFGGHSGAKNASANPLERSLEASELKPSRAFRIIRFGHRRLRVAKTSCEIAKPAGFSVILGVL
eukprot:gene11307-biopygen4843